MIQRAQSWSEDASLVNEEKSLCQLGVPQGEQMKPASMCVCVWRWGTKGGSSGTFRGTWMEPLGVQEASLKRNDALLVPVHLK